MNILIISSSIRENASTRRVAIHLFNHLAQVPILQSEFVDLTDYEYPIWKEVFHREISPPVECVTLHDKLSAADAMIFVTPEYNGSYSLALKNMVDYFGLKVFERKAIGVASVSTGALGGIRAAVQLQQLILAIYAIPVPQMLLVPSVQTRFDEFGKLLDDSFAKNVDRFVNDFLWFAEALHEKKKITVLQ
ncbi:MAG TPA: NAD(P)H-dependent oxidoreductase [Chitinophagales bacterium]|nr:NAD(P)H-dependent oxidoreductase [Chitinophagales bacterium]